MKTHYDFAQVDVPALGGEVCAWQIEELDENNDIVRVCGVLFDREEAETATNALNGTLAPDLVPCIDPGIYDDTSSPFPTDIVVTCADPNCACHR